MIVLVVAVCCITYILMAITVGTIMYHHKFDEEISTFLGILWPLVPIMILVKVVGTSLIGCAVRLHKFELNYLKNKK